MDRRTFLRGVTTGAAVGLAGCGLGGTGSPTMSPPDVPETALPALSTDGKWVVDEDGTEVVLRGLATVEPWWGMEYQNQRGADYWTSLELLTDREEGWYPGVVRVPCTTQWQEVGLETYITTYVDRIVRHCAEQDTYVIIDHHLVKQYDTDETDAQMREFWGAIAPRYAEYDHVLYELYNEPTEPAHWNDATAAWDTWTEHAQPWIDLVRDHAPDTPLIVGSPRWTSLTFKAAEDPMDGGNLIYSGHIYPSNGQPEEFDSTYGAPAEDVPVMITEFGWDRTGDPDVDRGTTSGWGEPFRAWLDSYPNMGWQGWCFDPVWEPALVDDDWNVLGGNPYAGHFLKRWLYETRDDRVPDALPTDGAAYEPPSDTTPPPVPDGVSATERGRGSFQVDWNGVADEETSTMFYEVYANGSVVGLSEIGPNSDATSLSVDATPGETYEVAVSAVDAVGNTSEPSDPITYEASGELSIATELPRASSAPTIDASVDDVWSGLTEHPFQHVIFGSREDESDLAGAWRGCWDDQALYLLVEVVDEAFSSDSGAQYNDDSVEVYLDADNSKNDSYDGENDFQFSFPHDGEPIEGQFPSDANVDQVEWERTNTDAGWRVEIAFPWSLLGVTPAVDHVLGLDVHVNDDDDGGERHGKISWFAEEDNSWQDPGLFANVRLVD